MTHLPAIPPTRLQLLGHMRALVKLLEQDGAKAEQMAQLLAARGWPTSTLGDGGSRGTSELTATERAATNPDRWTGVDEKLARWIVAMFTLVTTGHQFVADLAASAGTDDQHEGRATGGNGGWCLACSRWVAGTHEDRLRSGFCDSCRKAFARCGHTDRARFIHDRPDHDDAPGRQPTASDRWGHGDHAA